ncbi:N-acetylglucosamine-1-phosphate uridyltransferase [Halobacteriales archaeon QS_4_69_34]|nr:MAG: N-acetylglucosamine-1-phosphate uridyltransferase [Halobacteriales archaeon QS_4_69_34]
MRRIGFVLNPIAGMGGRVGLKGTDGKVAAARARGAEPRAPGRAREALDVLAERAHSEHAPDVELFAAGDPMGAAEARAVGFDPTVVTEPPKETTAADTRTAVRAFVERGVDPVLFVGGDGTAVDVAETLDECGVETPMLGVPAGVKVYSSVFAVSPRAAGRIAASFGETETAEVNDVDEDAYREGEVHTELRALARVPVAEERQSSKQLAGGTVETLAAGVASEVEPGVTYVLGPGSTLGAIEEAFGFEGTPLGVDVWRAGAGKDENGAGGADDADGRGGDDTPAGELLARDASADEIRAHLDDRNVVVVSPIGGQGFVFGRGNHQIAPDVIRRSAVEVVASRRKLDGVGVLRVDTGDPELDDALGGWWKVRTGRVERRMMKVV